MGIMLKSFGPGLLPEMKGILPKEIILTLEIKLASLYCEGVSSILLFILAGIVKTCKMVTARTKRDNLKTLPSKS